ncbi:hypothetical protein [Amycolatopsis mediterranei]|uniref:Uncharacterized protein n=1 Tax=Amycolatopsis mediterranei (strain S699) TaxID=713604 RepID=A0A9R0NU70_AMYMS|nr:hypothetical protein [Amycolatopsis mediterranei]AEK40657.1 hypothetical protein RAM_10835 [Amycolatopsis mediterranei S699]KDO04269.1 hypothetical protein DV26_44795 [Amycolatopsis mediterranei]KDU85420.1 hypothetical protein DV36_46300 [Amycolatopsis mediterranei]UZF69139.1 hypothetical protein ISP_002267 [Amycolatopsis mediterranei]
MNGGALTVLVVMAVPVVWIVVLLISDARHNRRVRARPERTVDGIRERVEREQAAADFASAPTEVFPAIQPAPADELTVELPPVLPKRPRPYVQRPTPYPRQPNRSPDPDLVARVLDGLRNLPDRPPPSWPSGDPDS